MAQRPAQPAPNQKTTAPEELIRRAAQQSGLPAAELLFEAAQGYKSKGDVVSVVHALDRALNEIAELIESPPAAKLGAALEFELGRTCEEDLGRFEEALLHYQRAFKLRPDYLEPLRRGRLIYQSLGDMDMVARLSELHLANLNAADAKSGVALALELGQLKLRLADPTGAIEVLRQALRLHNEAGDESEVPELLMATLAEAYVSPDYLPGASEKDQARRRASDIYLSLARRHLDPLLVQVLDRAQQMDSDGEEEDEGDQAGQKGKAAKPTLESLIAEAREGKEFTEGDKRAVMYLKKAMEADVRNVTAASLLETMYLRSPEPLVRRSLSSCIAVARG
jgi:tetratricopeptide (TPR) repeat protein